MLFAGQNSRSSRVQTLTVSLLSVAGAVCFLLMAFFTERVWGGEERALYNIPYTYVHEGKVAFPAYAYTSGILYDRLFVHPPAHYVEIAYLMKLGLPLYYAEALPALFWAIVCLVLVATAKFSFTAKLGLLCGVIGGVGWVATIGFWDYGFHLRPDAHMAFALLAGFLALAAAQVQSWEVRRFFVGALLVTYGSTIHYPGWCAWLGLAAFLFAARGLPWREYRIRLIAAVLGVSLAGMPYVIFHILPNREYLRQYSTFVSWARIPEAIRANFPVYRDVANLVSWKLPQMFYALPLNELFVLGIPPFAAALALLIWHRETRTMAFSLLPLSLFLFGIFERKLWSYFYLECMFVLIGVWLFVAWAWMKLAAFLPAKWGKLAGPLLAIVFLVGFGKYTPELTRVQWKRQRHEFGFLRARAKEIVGPNATIAAIHPLWYIAGARRWFDLTPELLRNAPPLDLRTYFSRFDDVAVLSMASLGTRTGINEASLYEQGILRLRGFLDSRNPPQSRLVFLSPRHELPVRGFYWADGKFFRFEKAPNGRLAIVSIVMSGDLQPFLNTLAPLRYWTLDLPNAAGQAIPRFVLVMLLDAQRYDRGDTMLAGVKPLEAIRGNAEQMDLLSMPPPADEVDPIDIPRSYSELLALIAKPSSAGLRASLQLSPYLENATVYPAPDNAKWFRVVAKRPLTGQRLASAEMPQLAEGRYYRIVLDLEMEAGGISIQAMQNGQVLESLYREIPLKRASVSFVVQCKGGSPLQLVLAAYNSLGSAPVRLRMSEPALEEVHLPD